jgi:hypothetical protein
LTKSRPGVKEYSFLGLLLGTMAAIKLFLYVGPWVLIIPLATAVLGGITVRWIQPLPDEVKHKIQYYIIGVIVGAMMGFSLFETDWLGIPVGLAIGVGFYRWVVSPWVARLKERDKYLSFPGEAFWVPLFSFIGVILGVSAFDRITAAFPQIPAWLTPEIWILLILLGSLLSFPLGIMVAANRYRPVIGGTFILIAGALVTWVGINIAPILFMPRSGLYWMGMIVGLAICAVAFLSLSFAENHMTLGITAIILSIVSFLGAAGGMFIGGILGILGGSMVLAWEKVALPQTEEEPEEPDDKFIEPPGDSDLVVS